jgi:phosphoglycolate phosphatase
VSPYHLVVFDFDGTLVDSARCIATSLERALADCGCPGDPGAVREQIGLPLHDILRAMSPGIDDRTIERAIEGYRRHYAELEHELIAPFPGARETIETLHRRGVALAIATNKLTARAAVTIERLGMRQLFAAIVGADQAAHPKPHPAILERTLAVTGHAAGDALMVGDTVWDLEMAARAGVAACAVAWGNHPVRRLLAARPAHVAGSFAALLDVVQPVAR